MLYYQHRKRLIVHHKLHRGETLPYFCLLLLSQEKNDLIKNYVCKMFLLDLTCFPTVPSLEKTLYSSALRNINASSVKEVMRIKDIITRHEFR